ncbi:hypothetical protein BDW68DRAFT_174763 [Aspergillus falconensis]
MLKRDQIASINAKLRFIQKNERKRCEELNELVSQLHLLLEDENGSDGCEVKDEALTKHGQLENFENWSFEGQPAFPKSTKAGKPASIRSIPSSPKLCRFYQMGKCRYGGQCRNIHTTPLRELSSSLSYNTSRSTSTQTKRSTRRGLDETDFAAILPIPGNPKLRDSIPVNNYGERIDPHSFRPSQSVWDAYNRQVQQHKLCNDYYITGECTGDKCPYYHGRLDFDPVDAIKYELRKKTSCVGKKPCRFDTYAHEEDLAVARWEAPEGRTTLDEWLGHGLPEGSSALSNPKWSVNLSLIDFNF